MCINNVYNYKNKFGNVNANIDANTNTILNAPDITAPTIYELLLFEFEEFDCNITLQYITFDDGG